MYAYLSCSVARCFLFLGGCPTKNLVFPKQGFPFFPKRVPILFFPGSLNNNIYKFGGDPKDRISPSALARVLSVRSGRGFVGPERRLGGCSSAGGP